MIRALRLGAIALMGLATSAAAAAPGTGQIAVSSLYNINDVPAPVGDPIARSKAPDEPNEAVDAVQAINHYVNTHIVALTDSEHYNGTPDYWVQYPMDHMGDCEDYALTKLGLLGQAGVPIISETKLVSVIVKLPKNKFSGHEILAVRLPKGTVVYLDNMNTEIMTRAELVKQGYIFYDWQA